MKFAKSHRLVDLEWQLECSPEPAVPRLTQHFGREIDAREPPPQAN